MEIGTVTVMKGRGRRKNIYVCINEQGTLKYLGRDPGPWRRFWLGVVRAFGQCRHPVEIEQFLNGNVKAALEIKYNRKGVKKYGRGRRSH